MVRPPARLNHVAPSWTYSTVVNSFLPSISFIAYFIYRLLIHLCPHLSFTIKSVFPNIIIFETRTTHVRTFKCCWTYDTYLYWPLTMALGRVLSQKVRKLIIQHSRYPVRSIWTPQGSRKYKYFRADGAWDRERKLRARSSPEIRCRGPIGKCHREA